MIAEFKGQNGKIIVHDDRIILSRATFGGFMSQGGSTGERIFFYKDITSFEYKKPTFFSNGYFKVIASGTKETNAKVGFLSSSFDSMKDQNTIVLRAFTKSVGDETSRIYDIIMDKLAESKKAKPIELNNISKADELKKLAELKTAGILTEDEFNAEKLKILNL